MIEIRLLKYFIAIVEEGSFSKAAERLHITQPTLSRQINDLEDFYETKLIDRTKHPIEITEDGLNFYHKARIITELDEKLEEDLLSKTELEGTVNIGSVESAGAEALYKNLVEISKEYPKLTFNFFHSDSNDIKEKLDHQLIDIGILTEPVDLNGLNYLKLPELDKWYILVSKDSKFKNYDCLKWDDLVDEPILLSKRFAKFREFPDFFNSTSNNFNILATYSLFSNAVYFVENNLAVAPCIETVHSIKNNDNVRLIPLYPEFKTGSYLVWKKDQSLNKPAQKLLDLLKKNIDLNNA